MNRRLNIKDIAVSLAESTGKSSNDIENLLKELIALLSEQIFIDKLVVIKGLGTFKIIPIEKRESIDVNTKERITIPGHYKLTFSPEKSLRETVNKPFSFFESIEINEDAAFAEMNAASESEETVQEQDDDELEDMVSEAEDQDLDEQEEESSAFEEIPETKETVKEVPIVVETKEEEVIEDIRKQSENSLEQPIPVETTSTTPDLTQEKLNDTSSEVTDEIEEEVSEPIEEVAIEEEIIPQEKQPNKKESTLKVILSVLFVVLLAVIGIVGYMNRELFFGSKKEIIAKEYPETKQEVIEKEPFTQEEVLVEDEIATEPEGVIPEEKVAPQPQSTDKDVIAKVKMQTGSRLTLLALEYYGNKVFWVYIYDYNKNVIKNPNNIPIGTNVSIPNPKLYGIDSKDATSIQKAAARQTELLSQ